MTAPKTLLLVDAGGEPLEDLSARLRGMGRRAVRAKTMDEGLRVISDARFAVGAVLVPPDLPAFDLERALHAFRRAEPDAPLPLIAVGRPPDPDARARLRRAGVEWALWRPVDDNTLRFQVNRALAGPRIGTAGRRAERVPTNWPVGISVGRRVKAGSVYSLSARGAFLSTERPSMPRTLVHVTLPLPGGDVRVAGDVVMTNVPGNLAKQGLPPGMGVRFTGQTDEVEEAILAYTRGRAETLRV